MNIDWNALGQVFGVSLVMTIGLVGVFTLGIVATARKPQQEEVAVTASAGGGAATVAATGQGPGTLARSAGYLCFTLCAAAVAYGISVIVI